MVYNFNNSFLATLSEEKMKNNTLEKLLFIATSFNASIESNIVGSTYSTSFNGTFKSEKNKEVDWFEYELVSTDVFNATEKPMFDYDTSVRVVMLSVLLGLAVMIIIILVIIEIIILLLTGLAIVGNSFAFQTLATDGAGGLGRS